MKDMSKFTYDSFFNGRIKIMQHKNGYRFSIDAVILADYASKRPAKRVLDLGTGCGIIPLIIYGTGRKPWLWEWKSKRSLRILQRKM